MKRQEFAVVPLSWVECLALDPARRVPVPAYFHVVAEGFGTYGLALVQEPFHFTQDECVALDSGAVVRLLMPGVGPDVLCLSLGNPPSRSRRRMRASPSTGLDVPAPHPRDSPVV